ncbi:MAG TPA: DUF4132 domain-containing protein, partial [Segetibacter sp.]
MPFTIQKLNEFFDQFQENSYPLNASFKSLPNYKIVVDYLTGTSNSLQGIIPDHENFALQGLLSLVEKIDLPSPNDQLIIDVVMDPNIFPYVQQVFAQWLVFYAAKANTASAISAVESTFKSLGRSNDEIFFLFIYFLQYSYQQDQQLVPVASELRKYLLGILPKKLSINPYAIGHYWGSIWSVLYFELLEEGMPALLKDYIVEGLIASPAYVAECIFHYRQGKYLSTILDWLNHPSISNVDFEHKFTSAVYLYEKDNLQYQQLVLAFSKKYLDHFRVNKAKEKWERGIHIKLSEANETSHIVYSAAAFHFLFLDDQTLAKELVFEWFRNKIIVSFDILQVLFHHIQKDALPYLALGLKADASIGGIEYYRKIINLLVKEFQPADYVEILWELTSSKSKPLREEVAKLLAEKDAEAEQKAIQLLQSKNAEARQTAALILSFFNSANAIAAVKAILNAEANDNARDILLQIASSSLPARVEKAFIEEMVQAAAGRNKLNKPLETWLNETDLPSLFYEDDEQLSALEVRFLFYRMSRVKAMRSDIEAKYLIELLDKERAVPFAKHLIQLFIDKEAKTEYKYLMALAAMLGGDETVDKLRSVINGWIEIYRTKMVEYGIGALALQGSNKALRLVEYYSRKYKNKTASVGAAALQALEDAAEELGISTHELGDRIVPDFGFDGLFKHFTIRGEEYRAFIDSNFKLAFFDEDNKKLKALPSTADKELKEEFKNIVKEVRDVVKSQSLRLEHYLVTQRRWNSEEWQNFYLTNPVMFIYATKLLWGKYDSDGNLLDCFLSIEDTSLINIEDDEIELNDDEFVGIVHPIQLDAASLQKWKKKLFDLSVETIFPQLERKIAVV